MKTAVVYYSYNGSTKKLAEKMAKEQAIDCIEVRDPSRPGALKAYVAGCFAAVRQKAWPIVPEKLALDEYETIILMAPVWAGHPAPQIHAVIQNLPQGKEIAFMAVSASGNSSAKEKIQAAIEAKGCSIKDYQNIRTGS